MRRRLFRLFALALSLLLLAAATLVISGLRDSAAPADVALVLGNTVLPDGRPSARLQARLDRAAELYRAHDFPVLIVSGGRGKEGHDEAAVMAGYLVAHGIPRTNIVEDHQGLTTWDSARFTAAWLPSPRTAHVVVISQYFHVPRAALALRRFGIGTVYTAHARYFELRDLYSILRELAGCVSYSLRSYPAIAPTPSPPGDGESFGRLSALSTPRRPSHRTWKSI